MGEFQPLALIKIDDSSISGCSTIDNLAIVMLTLHLVLLRRSSCMAEEARKELTWELYSSVVYLDFVLLDGPPITNHPQYLRSRVPVPLEPKA